MNVNGSGLIVLEKFRAQALKIAANFAYKARRTPVRSEVLKGMVAAFAEIFHADSVVYYDLNTSGRLRAHTSNRPELVLKSHVQDAKPDGPLKTVLESEGFVFVPSVLQPSSYILLDRQHNLAFVRDNPLDAKVIHEYQTDFGKIFEQTGEKMSMGFGCLSVPEKKFGAFKIDSFSSGRSILPKGMSPGELLDLFSLVAAFAASELDAMDVRLELESQRNEARKMFEDIKSLADGATHAFKNRLNPVKLGIQIARKYPEKAGPILKRTEDNLDETIKYVRDYFSPVKEGKLKIEISPRKIYLAELVGEARETLSFLDKNIEIKVDDALPESMITDKNKLLDVIYELVENARKYSGPSSKIELAFEAITGEDGQQALKVSVTDQGVGMNEEQIQRLFRERNLRFHPELNRENSTGNGLYVCGQIIEMLGATIQIVSEVGRGSTFSIIHPIVEL